MLNGWSRTTRKKRAIVRSFLEGLSPGRATLRGAGDNLSSSSPTPPGYSVDDATDAFDCQHDLDGPWRERQREVGDCRKSVSSRKCRVLGECRECAGAR